MNGRADSKKKGSPGRKPQGRRSKGKDEFTKRQRDVESMDMRADSRLPDSHDSRPNDWRWYASSQQLINDYASFAYGYPLGAQVKLSDADKASNAVPGIFVIDYLPAVGYAENAVAPINLAMRRLYSQVRKENSGATNYDPADMMLYMICVDSAAMYLEEIKRVYGVMMNYSPYNYYTPKDLVAALGYDYDDLEQHLTDLRGYINVFAAKLSQLWIPNSLSVTARHMWMASGIYADSAAAKAQYYIYRPAGYYQFGLDANQAGQAEIRAAHWEYTQTLCKFENIVGLGNTMIEPMISNQDFSIMSGDILKAFGSSGVIKFMGITENYQVLPVYSTEVLSQIENAVAVPITRSSLTVSQATGVGEGYLLSRPTALGSFTKPPESGVMAPEAQTRISSAMTGNVLINMHMDQVTPVDSVVATRLTNLLNSVTWSESDTEITWIGQVKTVSSEAAIRFTIYYRTFSPAGVSTLQHMPVTSWYVTNLYEDVINMLSAKGTFDWAPEVNCWCTIAGASSTAPFSVTHNTFSNRDLDNYTVVTAQNLENMAQLALLSEFTLPQI